MSISSPSSQVPEPLLELAEKLHNRTFDPATTEVKGDLSVLEADDSGDSDGDCLLVVLQDGDREWRVTGYRHFFRDKCKMTISG
ncbi:MAG: hypothetical protein WCX61_04000 [Candidatus Peribacteraceae bacterium]|jgi:hypothetical protein